MSTVLKFYPTGRVQAMWDGDEGFPFEKAFGPEFVARRKRASIIDTINDGPRAGHFYADMSYLAEQTGEDRHRICLLATSKKEADVKRAEYEYVRDQHIRKEH